MLLKLQLQKFPAPKFPRSNSDLNRARLNAMVRSGGMSPMSPASRLEGS